MTNEKELSLELGIEDQIMTISESQVMSWMEKGIIVEVHISHWRPYASLNEADLGITKDAETGNYLQLGRKKLLPPNLIAKLETLELKARANLKNNSLPCPWGRFIPATLFHIWKENNDNYKTTFYEIRDELVEILPESINQLRDIYTKMAEDAYKRLLYDQSAIAPNEFISNFVNQCISKIPAPSIVGQTFRYQERYSYVPLLQQVSNYLKEETEAEKEMKLAVTKEMENQKKEMVSDFLADVSSSLRIMIFEACAKVQEGIIKNDKLLPSSATRLKNIIEKVGSLNFYNDQQVDNMITDIKNNLVQYESSSTKDVKSISDAINGVLQTCASQVDQIVKWRPSRFEALELNES